MYQTYSSTSLRCTDLFPPHRGIVKAGEGDAMVSGRRARARSGYTHTKDGGRRRDGGCVWRGESESESESCTGGDKDASVKSEGSRCWSGGASDGWMEFEIHPRRRLNLMWRLVLLTSTNTS
jgi:hypothetical protein